MAHSREFKEMINVNEIMKFEFENNENLECIELDGNPLFNPFSVGKCLGIADKTVLNTLYQMDDEDVAAIDESLTRLKGKESPRVWLKESGLYLFIFKSRKPEAKSFKKWVAREVLPSIRRTGSYELNTMVEKQLETTLHGVKILTGIEPEELAIKQNESWRAKLANLVNDIAKREQIGTKALYERLYFLFAGETGFHIPELAKEANLSNSAYLKQHELSAKMLYEFALAYFYKDKRFVDLISLNPDQSTLTDFKI